MFYNRNTQEMAMAFALYIAGHSEQTADQDKCFMVHSHYHIDKMIYKKINVQVAYLDFNKVYILLIEGYLKMIWHYKQTQFK